MRSFAFVALLALCAAIPLNNSSKPLNNTSTDRIGSVSVQGDNTQVGETINNQFGRHRHRPRPRPSFPQNDFDPEPFQRPSMNQGYQPYDSGFGGGIDQVNVRGPNAQVANDLNNFGFRADVPVLKATEKEHEILHKAVTEVVNADPKVPQDKKDEVINTTVNEIKKEFRDMGMTHGDLIKTVEDKAAKPATDKEPATDRSGRHGGHYGHGHGYGHGYGHHYGGYGRYGYGRYGYGGYYPGYYGYYSGYYPGYYPGYGYYDCLNGYSYPYCQQQLYGAYAYYRSLDGEKTEKIDKSDQTNTITSTKTQITGRSDYFPQTELRADETPKAVLSNLTETSKKVEVAAAKDRLEDASYHAETVKEIVKKADEKKIIDKEDAKAIVKAADNVQKSAAAGDQSATLEHAKNLKNRSLLGDLVKEGAEILL